MGGSNMFDRRRTRLVPDRTFPKCRPCHAIAALLALGLCLAAGMLALALATPAYAAPSGDIAGTVTNASHSGLENIDVTAYQSDGSGGWNYVNDVNTASDGSYDIGGLAAGTYRVEFNDGSGVYLSQCYNNQTDLDSATDVTVTAGETAGGVDATLALAGHITGTVTNASHSGLENIDVTAYQSDGSGGWNYVNDVYTAPDGSYDIGGLSTGSYRVEFSDGSGSYASQYYDGKTDLDSATDIPVTAGEATSNINATLADAGHITGTVINSGSHGLAGIQVVAYQANGSGGWNNVNSTATTSGGGYDLGGLAAGTYRVEFNDGSGVYLTQCYDGKADLDLATDVVVSAGVTKQDINATLVLAGDITGTVTNASHSGLENIDVTAYQSDGSGGWNYVNDVYTASDGSYDLGGLVTGEYRLAFYDESGSGYATQYYDNQPSLDAADDVAVTAGATTSGRNATLAIPGSDTTPPTTVVSGVDSAWQTSAVKVTLTATDNPGGSGVALTEYRLHGAATWTLYTAPFDISAQGISTYDYRSIDEAENAEAVQNFTVKIDSIAPTGSFTLNNGAAATGTPDVTVNNAVSDANGVTEMRFSTDGKATWSSWASYSATAALTLPAGNGPKTVWGQYQDPAGNVFETSASITLNPLILDTTPPTISASGVQGGAWLNHSATIALRAVDNPGGSGVAAISYTLDGVAHTVAAASASVLLATIPNATHTLSYSASDLAGNSSATQSLTLHIDTIGPTTSVKAAKGRRGKAITLKYLVRDNLSPQATAVTLTIKNAKHKVVKTYKLGTEKTATWYALKWKPKAKGSYSYSIAAKDLAGNKQAKAGSARITVK